MQRVVETDVLVIGGGGTAARAAIEAKKYGAQVVIVLKGRMGKSGTTASHVADVAHFQAAVKPPDSPDVHYSDILAAGLGMCDERLAQILADEAPTMVTDLEKMGVSFEKKDGKHLLATGCFASRPRSHVIKEHAFPIISALKREIEKNGIPVAEDTAVTNLLIADGRCVGATAVSKGGDFFVFKSKATILGTGGAGQLFILNLNPPDITGDGYAVAYRAGAELTNMEFMQAGFGTLYPIKSILQSWVWYLHPILRNGRGQEFIHQYLPEGEEVERCMDLKATHFPFSTRDASQYLEIGVQQELNAGKGTEHPGVYIDFTGIDKRDMDRLPEEMKSQWKMTKEWFLSHNVDLEKHPIEIAPFAHAINGGLRITEYAESTIPLLYAAGEVAAGPHGADRLGGNMLVACQVFGTRAGRHAAEKVARITAQDVDKDKIAKEQNRLAHLYSSSGKYSPSDVRRAIQTVMSKYALITRSAESLTQCIEELTNIRRNHVPKMYVKNRGQLRGALEAENLIDTGLLMSKAALFRTESRGGHYRSDFPQMDGQHWRKNIIIKQSGGQMKLILAHICDFPKRVIH